MRYIDRVLQPDERVRHTAKLHWILYVPGLLVTLFAAVPGFAYPADWPLPQIVRILAWLIAAGGLALLFRAWFEQWTTEIAVTDRRIVFKRGFIRRYTVEMNMAKVESVDVDQSIMGRILGYGRVTIRGTGTGFEPLPTIAAPLELRNHITAE